MKSRIPALLVTTLISMSAFGQCAPGIPGAGNPGCIPPTAPNSPYNQGGDAPVQGNQPQGRWEDRWGAVAVDTNSGKAGVAENRASESSASRTAIDQCQSNGGRNCEVTIAYHNQCVAVAQKRSGGPIMTSSAAQQDQAADHALSNCGGRDICQVMYQFCSYAERVD